MEVSPPARSFDLAIVGGGAAGLAAAIFAARRTPGRAIALCDGAERLGAKILASGGGRCNVANAGAGPDDFHGSSRPVVGRILQAFDSARAIRFFEEVGAPLVREDAGRLYPRTQKARTILDALTAELHRLDVAVLTGCRVTEIDASGGSFRLATSRGAMAAGKVLLATGGLSLPKTGSDGGGYALAIRLGHTLVPTTPALVPLVLEGSFHPPLSGISQEGELTIHAASKRPARLRGALLWTHFGISGPAVLDASRVYLRERLEGRSPVLRASFLPGEDFQSADTLLLTAAAAHPGRSVGHLLPMLPVAARGPRSRAEPPPGPSLPGPPLPVRWAEALLREIGLDPEALLAHLPREDRRRLAHALTGWDLPVRDSRGYAYAEVTAGGVPLQECDPRSLESRRCPGLFFAGEILDVDGRLGGFNFQWAWSSAWVAGTAV
jgi:predicted Rossmann fold flavoprotein